MIITNSIYIFFKPKLERLSAQVLPSQKIWVIKRPRFLKLCRQFNQRLLINQWTRFVLCSALTTVIESNSIQMLSKFLSIATSNAIITPMSSTCKALPSPNEEGKEAYLITISTPEHSTASTKRGSSLSHLICISFDPTKRRRRVRKNINVSFYLTF